MRLQSSNNYAKKEKMDFRIKKRTADNSKLIVEVNGQEMVLTPLLVNIDTSYYEPFFGWFYREVWKYNDLYIYEINYFINTGSKLDTSKDIDFKYCSGVDCYKYESSC